MQHWHPGFVGEDFTQERHQAIILVMIVFYIIILVMGA